MKKRGAIKFILGFNICMVLFYLAPMYWTFITSIKDKGEIYSNPPTLFPKSFSWFNYVRIFTEKEGMYRTYFMNSVVIDGLTILLVCIVSLLAGYAFSKLELLGKNLWLTLILAAIMVPSQALMVPLYNTVSQLKLLNTKAALILIYATFQSPFCIYMMKSTFDMIPKDLAEAALIDGAGNFATFFKIYMPLAASGVVTIAVYVAYSTWNDYLTALVFAGKATKTFNVGLVNMAMGEYSTDWGILTAGAYIGLLPIMILFLFLQKYFVKGMMSGAVK